MRSSAAFVFQTSPLTGRPYTPVPNGPAGLTSSAASTQALPSHCANATSQPCRRADAGDVDQCASSEPCVTPLDGTAPRMRSHSRFIPRPVTVKQLWWAYISSAPTASVFEGSAASTAVAARDREPLRHPPDTLRVGDASVRLDGSPCSNVVICGRVLARRGPEANGSVRLRHPYSLLVVTDHTSAVYVLQYHTLLPAVPPVEPLSDPHTPPPGVEEVDGSTVKAVHGTRGKCFSDEPWPCTLRAMSRVSPEAAALRGHRQQGLTARADAEETAVAAATTTTHTDAATPVSYVDNGGHAVFPTHTPTSSACGATDAFFGGEDAIVPEELDVRPGDYVSCVGRLCYTDVERNLPSLFTDMCLPSPVETLRRAAEAATASSQHSTGGARQKMTKERSFCASPTHAWLPHAEAPVRLADLTALGMSRDALPAGTRLATLSSDTETTEEGAGGAVDETFSPPLATVVPRTGRASKAVASPSTPTVPFVVKGKATVLADSNEWMYWTLTALHTHLRLTRDAQRREPSR